MNKIGFFLIKLICLLAIYEKMPNVYYVINVIAEPNV